MANERVLIASKASEVIKEVLDGEGYMCTSTEVAFIRQDLSEDGPFSALVVDMGDLTQDQALSIEHDHHPLHVVAVSSRHLSEIDPVRSLLDYKCTGIYSTPYQVPEGQVCFGGMRQSSTKDFREDVREAVQKTQQSSRRENVVLVLEKGEHIVFITPPRAEEPAWSSRNHVILREQYERYFGDLAEYPGVDVTYDPDVRYLTASFNFLGEPFSVNVSIVKIKGFYTLP